MITKKTLDIICLGRAAVDFYGDQIGSRLEDMGNFSKYLGGSSANIAYGCARLGLKSAMLTRVGDEHMGRFVREELAKAGVDVSCVKTDKHRLTGLVILGIKEKALFPLIFYRRDCADMAIDENDFSPEFIASAKTLLITGTHFSTESTYKASMTAIRFAKKSSTQVVLDIDYRPVLWGLTGAGEGEVRYVSSENTTSHLQRVLPHCDIVVGTEEEIHIAGGDTNTIAALKHIRKLTSATIVLKLGALGCTVLDKDIPDSAADFTVFKGNTVDVFNVLGAGDAFLAGFMFGCINGKNPKECSEYANACGAIVVSRHGCAPATPTAEELFHYLNDENNVGNPSTNATLNHIHFATTRFPKRPEICALAFDHRRQLFDLSKECDVCPTQIKKLKNLLVKAVERGIEETGLQESAAGVLIDDTYGQDALNTVTGRPWWIARPVELPFSIPLELEGGRSIGTRLKTWPLEHVVKCLVFYGTDDPFDLRLAQERQMKELFLACRESGHQLLLEIIPSNNGTVDEHSIPRSLRRLYHLGIAPDWWKLPPLSDSAWETLAKEIPAHDCYCQGILLLGLSVKMEQMKAALVTAGKYDICKGFTVGRTLFYEPAKRWMKKEISDVKFTYEVAGNYADLINIWRVNRHKN